MRARLVDAAGRLVRPRNVAAIRYTLYEVIRMGPDRARILTIRACSALHVDDVLFDALRSDKLWTADACGYNFRHEIDVSELRLPQEYEVQYTMRPTFEPNTTIRLTFRSHRS